jgi:carboxylesterase
MTPSPIMRGAEPFMLRGGDVGVLCVHGFTANPSETRWLGESLAARGLTVYGARLAGHGTHPHDLARTRWRDWLASALDGYHLLRGLCRRVHVVGHSMGGLLALLLATTVEVASVSVLASPIMFPPRLHRARWQQYLVPFTNQADTSAIQDVIKAEQARRGEPVIGRVRYDQWSTAAVYQLVALAGQVESVLPQVSAPLLLVYSRSDKTVPYAHADYIAARVGSDHVERRTLEYSGHILPQDSERETVFDWVGTFVGAIK